ncbi:hypothetical protein Tco_0814823 [Tanacetum coccineum]
MLGSSSPASWQGSNTQIVVRTIVGIWYRFDIRIPEPYLSLFENDHCLTSQQFAIHYNADCMWNRESYQKFRIVTYMSENQKCRYFGRADDDKYLFTCSGTLSLSVLCKAALRQRMGLQPIEGICQDFWYLGENGSSCGSFATLQTVVFEKESWRQDSCSNTRLVSNDPVKIEKFCLNCGDPIHGFHCQGCALIQKTFEEVLQDFQDTSESSDDNTNVVNAPREPIVVNQDPGENSSPNPLHIDHCCHECGDSLDGIFCRQCTCKSCGKGAHYGYNCPPKVPIISNPEPCKNQTIGEHLQNLQSLQQQCLFGTCQRCGCNEYDGVCFYCKVGNETQINVSTPYSSNDSPSVANHPPQPQYVPYSCEIRGNDSHYGYDCPPQVPSFITPQYTVNHPIFNSQNELLNSQNKLMEQMATLRDLVDQVIQKKEEEKRIAKEQAAKDRSWKIPICYDDDEDNTIVITPVLPIEELDNSLSMGDKHLDTIPETESDEFIKSSVENLVLIPSDWSRDGFLGEKLLNINLLIAKIDSLRDNPTPSSEVVIKSTSTFPNLFLEETNTFDNSIPESETFRFNLEEISIPPTDRSDFNHEEFADELAHIISPPEYDHFCFKIEPELGNLTMDVVNDIFPTREPRVHVPNVLPTHPTLDTDFHTFK